jgi:hypothetical protein
MLVSSPIRYRHSAIIIAGVSVSETKRSHAERHSSHMNEERGACQRKKQQQAHRVLPGAIPTIPTTSDSLPFYLQ